MMSCKVFHTRKNNLKLILDYSSVLNQRRGVRIRFFTVYNILGDKDNMSRKFLVYILHITSHHNKENIAQFTLHAQLQFVMSIFLTFGESLSRYNGLTFFISFNLQKYPEPCFWTYYEVRIKSVVS